MTNAGKVKQRRAGRRLSIPKDNITAVTAGKLKSSPQSHYSSNIINAK